MNATPTTTAILDVVEHQLCIDEAWIVRRADGFTWWPGVGLRQDVRVEGPVAVDGLPTWWLVIETPVWRGVDAATLRALHGPLERMRVDGHGAAVKVDAAQGTASLVSRVHLMPETVQQHGRVFAGLGPIQARRAFDGWTWAGDAMGDSAAAFEDHAPHPVSGEREVPDEILGIPEHVIVPGATRPAGRGEALLSGAVASLVAGGLGTLAQRGPDHGWFVVDVGPRGALVMCSLMASELTGPSLAITTLLDLRLDEASAAREATELLNAELSAGSMVWTLGSWVVRPCPGKGAGYTLLGSSFLPVGLFAPGFARMLPVAMSAKVAGLRRRYGGSNGASMARRATRSQRVPKRSS